jgi:hypothetical protein
MVVWEQWLTASAQHLGRVSYCISLAQEKMKVREKNVRAVQGIELRALHLLSKCSTTYTTPQPFLL